MADATHRQHLLDGWGDWDSFFLACDGDGLLDEQAAMTRSLDETWMVALLTSRPVWVQRQTTLWLYRHEDAVRWDLLIMRPGQDWRSSAAFKREETVELRARGFDVAMAVDDDRRNVAMFRDQGIPTTYIDSGYHP